MKVHTTEEIFLYFLNIPIPVNYRSLRIVTISSLHLLYISYTISYTSGTYLYYIDIHN